MGAEAANSFSPPEFSLNASPIQQKTEGAAGGPVIQRAATDQEGHYGKFKPENYGKSSDGKKLHAAIKFEPNEEVDATKIGFTQVIRKNVEGKDVAIDPAADNRMVDSGAGEGFRIDRISNKNNPIYGAKDLSGSDGLDKTKQDNNSTSKDTELNPDKGRNATYELGHRYNDASGASQEKDAGLYDGPTIKDNSERTVEFESTALAIEGNQKDTYLGSVKWGYKVDDKKNVTELDFEKISDGTPSINFMAAAEKWNGATVRGTYEAIEDGVKVHKVGSFSTELGTLKKGDTCTHLKPVTISGVQYVRCDITSGALKGKKGNILVSKLKDKGDGGATVNLPIDKVYLTTKATELTQGDGTKIALPKGARLILKNAHPATGDGAEVQVGDGEHTGKKGMVPKADLVDEKTQTTAPPTKASGGGGGNKVQ